MSDHLYIDVPPASDARINEVHVWIGTQADGGEGMLSADLEIMPGVHRHMPLLSSKRAAAERLRPLAERCVQAAATDAGRTVSIALVTYRRVAP